MRSRHVAVVLAAVFAVVLVAACKPKPGAKCKKEGETKCVGDKAALVCAGGKWEALPCRGLNGCLINSCTNEGYLEGEPCTEEGNWNCSVDKKAMFQCSGAHWVKKSDCRGQHGCVANASGANCDMGTGEIGDMCSSDNEGNGACSGDKKSLLVCKAGKMVLDANCRGQHGCRQTGDKLQCDDSISKVGDPCRGENNPSCSEDKKQLHKCKGGKIVLEKACKGGCQVFLDEIRCN